jgi:hypothetical protein
MFNVNYEPHRISSKIIIRICHYVWRIVKSIYY